MRMILSIVRLRICVSHHGWTVVILPQRWLTRCVQIKWSSSQMHETRNPRSFPFPASRAFYCQYLERWGKNVESSIGLLTMAPMGSRFVQTANNWSYHFLKLPIFSMGLSCKPNPTILVASVWMRVILSVVCLCIRRHSFIPKRLTPWTPERVGAWRSNNWSLGIVIIWQSCMEEILVVWGLLSIVRDPARRRMVVRFLLSWAWHVIWTKACGSCQLWSCTSFPKFGLPLHTPHFFQCFKRIDIPLHCYSLSNLVTQNFACTVQLQKLFTNFLFAFGATHRNP